jgi:potassium efflux system protein
MPGRTKTVRERLTQLGAIQAELESQLALMSTEQSAGGEGEARLWRALAEQASHAAEKASLDEELLSEPMRMELLKAQLDKVSLDIKLVESRLQALESRAGELRQDEVAQARAEATLVQEGTRGKHELVQALADENAGLTEDFTGRSALIEQVRQREAARRGQAEQIEADLKSIEHKVEVLGMTAAIGQILREQAVQLPSRNEARREAFALREQVRDSSMRQIELEDERRKLRDRELYLQERLAGVAPGVAEELRDDLLELAANRRDLVTQAVELENTYGSALGDLDPLAGAVFAICGARPRAGIAPGLRADSLGRGSAPIARRAVATTADHRPDSGGVGTGISYPAPAEQPAAVRAQCG